MIYEYKCPIHGVIEIEHKISEVVKFCPKCLEETNSEIEVSRLISKGSGFILKGGGWASSNYS
jgi:hypothetical protein